MILRKTSAKGGTSVTVVFKGTKKYPKMWSGSAQHILPPSLKRATTPFDSSHSPLMRMRRPTFLIAVVSLKILLYFYDHHLETGADIFVGFTSVIIVLGAFQGFLLFISLRGMKRGNTAANSVAGYFVLFISITLLGRYAYTVTTSSLFMAKILFVGDFVIFFYGPLLYLYFVRLFNVRSDLNIRTWMHFIPLAVFGIVIMPFIVFDEQQFVEYSTRMEYIFYALELFAIIQNYFYLFVNVRLLRKYQLNSLKVSSVMPQINFYQILLGITLIGLFFWTVSFAFRFIGPEELRGYLGYQLVWISLSVLIIGLGYFILTNPEVFEPLRDELPAPLRTIPSENLKELNDRLTAFMQEQRPYLEPKLSLPELAERTGINTHMLSRIVNEYHNMNFFVFINTYRVEEFKRIATAENLRQRTLLALALDAGFNSKTTFNAAFKKIMNITPREYIQSLR